MPVTIVCPGCNAKLKAPDNLIGKAVKCPTCSKPVLVKAPGAPAPAAPPPAPKKPVRPPEPVLEEEPLEEEEMDAVEEELDSPPVKKKKKGASEDALAGGPSTDKERSTAMWIYFLPYVLACCGGIGTFVSLFLWISKRKDSAFIDYHGKNWLNLIINSIAITLPLAILSVVGQLAGNAIDSTVGMLVGGLFGFLIFIVGMYFFVMMILSGLKAKKGEYYQPKMAFRLLK